MENLEGQLQKRLEQINSMVSQLVKEKNTLQKEYDETQTTVKSLEKMKTDIENKVDI